MDYRDLGRTGIQISVLSFGAGPISTLMVGDDRARQVKVVAHAVERGINWFDTAATYGGGQSETNLGRALEELGASGRVHVATKVRLSVEDLSDIRRAVRRSFADSLKRLRLPRVTLLQLHNSITQRRGDEPTSITPSEVLSAQGVAETFNDLRAEGLVSHVGLTGIGNPAALAEVVNSGSFETMQTPFHLLNPSAGHRMAEDFGETNYGNIIANCAQVGMGVLAIRVLAGGALAGNPPSPHTLKTPFFPLDLFERDRRRATHLCEALGLRQPLPQAAIRFALAHPHISSALIGFGEAWQVDQALEAMVADVPPLNWDDLLLRVPDIGTKR